MAKRRLDLPEDRPASFDGDGHHVAQIPAAVSGRYRKWRDWVYLALIAVFLVLPWTQFGGHQTVLLDIPNRQFALFGLTFWAHDIPLMFFVLGILTVGLTLMTAVLGRVWCGWACPQTVFIDRVYRRIEEWVEGNHVKRLHLAEAPMSWSKFGKKSLKWFLFWFVSANIAHSFTAYFVGSERLLQMSLTSPSENWTPFLFVTITTAILMFDFGWFREQFCIIMCPYGRIQSVLMDKHSVAILYDEQRGEPRKGSDAEATGDCVNCYKCVAVCPTGVDIRRGVQMECVACTACMDACDEIMRNVGKPEGLIRYASEESIQGRKTRFMRPRSLIYSAILLAMFAGLAVGVGSRSVLDAQFIRAIDTPYTEHVLEGGAVEIANHYRVHMKNQRFEDAEVALMVEGNDDVTIVAPMFPLTLAPGEDNTLHVFFKFPRELTAETGRMSLDITLVVTLASESSVIKETVSLVGPFGGAKP